MAEERPGKQAEMEMEVMESRMTGAEDQDESPSLNERREVEARELTSSTGNCSRL